ncbi:hypothetical protein Nepgr_010425 [Nepenthes gracilis]|uniref:Uncharacterized protein n=1 Tax=Nepenthes gracilis TaxID=150966 RepID=A0AAD3SCF6_NEPGR|nr:hypothetical protein Nepgr_010425 [Nepenthes gracilis]
MEIASILAYVPRHRIETNQKIGSIQPALSWTMSSREEGVTAGKTSDIKLDSAAEPGYSQISTFPIKESDARLSNQVTRGRNLSSERETRSWERRKARVSSGTGAQTNRSFKETCEKEQAEEVKRMPEEELEEPRGCRWRRRGAEKPTPRSSRFQNQKA